MSMRMELLPFDASRRCPYCGNAPVSKNDEVEITMTFHPSGPAYEHAWGADSYNEVVKRTCSVVKALWPHVLPHDLLQAHIEKHCTRCGGNWAEQPWEDLDGQQQAWQLLRGGKEGTKGCG